MAEKLHERELTATVSATRNDGKPRFTLESALDFTKHEPGAAVWVTRLAEAFVESDEAELLVERWILRVHRHQQATRVRANWVLVNHFRQVRAHEARAETLA